MIEEMRAAAHPGSPFYCRNQLCPVRPAPARLELLATAQSVTTIALELGYENDSAFVAISKRMMGVTQGSYGDGITVIAVN